MDNKIVVTATINADRKKVWDYYTKPEHITQWNFAMDTWHCPSASNDLRIGGRYVARMEARDGSFGFDFDAVYTHIREGESFTYEFGDRQATVEFIDNNGHTAVIITFDPENQNPLDLQQNGWQAILDNFKKYTENN